MNDRSAAMSNDDEHEDELSRIFNVGQEEENGGEKENRGRKIGQRPSSMMPSPADSENSDFDDEYEGGRRPQRLSVDHERLRRSREYEEQMEEEEDEDSDRSDRRMEFVEDEDELRRLERHVDGEHDEEINVHDDEMLPAAPIATATLEGAMKRKTNGDASGVIGQKRVRITEPIMNKDDEESALQYVEAIIAMGYPREVVLNIFNEMNRVQDYNTMIDLLLQNQQEKEMGGQTNSPFNGEPIQSTSSVLENMESINEIIRPSPQKPSPTFNDLCEDGLLRKYLTTKYAPTSDSCKFVCRTSIMMAQRLSQVNYVSKVARLSSEIFSMHELYRHFRNMIPSEPASDIIDRRGIIKENDAPLGVLIDVAEGFVNNSGLLNIADRIKDPAMSIRDIGSLCSILADLQWMAFPGSLDSLMAEAAEKMRSMMKEYSEKEIRDERTRREIFDAARKVCKGITPGITTSPRYEFIERLMLCGNMEAKKNAIDELASICDHEMGESCSLRRWMKTRNILPILLSDHLDHPEYVTKIAPILRKLAPIMSEREFRSVWCLQKGRGGISLDTFNHILVHIASGFQEDQIIMLFKYFKKQMKQMKSCQRQHTIFMRVTESLLGVLGMSLKPVMQLKEKQTFIEQYIRLIDRYLTSPSTTNMYFHGGSYGQKVAQLFRNCPAGMVGNALGKLAGIVSRLKDNDNRFIFYITLIHHLCMVIKQEFPKEYQKIGEILGHYEYSAKSTRMIIAYGRAALLEATKMEQVSAHHEGLLKQKLDWLNKLQQEIVAVAAGQCPADSSAPGASSEASSTVAQGVTTTAAAPPPSAVTPISNGPSPKRDGSPASTVQVSPETHASTSNGTASTSAPVAVKENDAEKKEEAVSVCTPPCTPEPLCVSVARVGTKEFEQELNEAMIRMNCIMSDMAMRMNQLTNLATLWQEQTMADEPTPSCTVLVMKMDQLEDMFAMLVDISRLSLYKKLVSVQYIFYGHIQMGSLTTYPILRKMLGLLVIRPPVFRKLITQMCAAAADQVTPAYVDIVRTTADLCLQSANLVTSSDWLEEILRFLWKLATCKANDVREKANEVLRVLLVDRYHTMRLLEIFAIERFNEAVENFTRLTGRPPLPRWKAHEKEEIDNEEMMEEEEEGEDKENKENERNGDGENGEEAVDLTQPRAPRTPAHSQFVCVDEVEQLMRRMTSVMQPTTKEEAEMQLSRAIAFIRRTIHHGYLHAKNPPVAVRERAIPGETCQMRLRCHSQHSSPVFTICMAANEPMCVFIERARHIIQPTPQNWPRGVRMRHYDHHVSWDRKWASVSEQMRLNTRQTSDDVAIITGSSPFNDDFITDAFTRREPSFTTSMSLDEKPLGNIANETRLASILLEIVDGGATNHLQDSVLCLIAQLPFYPIEGAQELENMCEAALELQKPHEALYNLISLLGTLLPPALRVADLDIPEETLSFITQTEFVHRFIGMLKEIDVISDRLSVESMTLFHETCLTLIRLFFLNDSGKHRAYHGNQAGYPSECAPIDTSSIMETMMPTEMPFLLRALIQFTWAVVAPRRADVEKEMNLIVTSPSVRIQYAKEKKVENNLTHRRIQLARKSIGTILEIAGKYGSFSRNMRTLFSASTTDDKATCFWRDVLMNMGAIEIQLETRNQLSHLLDKARDYQEEDELHNLKRLIVKMVFRLGRGVWGPANAVEYAKTGRSPVELLRLAEKVVKTTPLEDFEGPLIEQWIALQLGFLDEHRPLWSTRCHMGVHVQLLHELLRKQEKETMVRAVSPCLRPLFRQALFPFAASVTEINEQRCGRLPAPKPVGAGLAEGDVRKKYMDIVLYYCQECPEKAIDIVQCLADELHSGVLKKRPMIAMWEKAERVRRQRIESFCGPQMSLAQRLHSLTNVREIDVRMVKGLSNPSYMCYANSVLQQLVFMPGVCEAMYALGDFSMPLGNLMEPDEIRNGTLLHHLQTLFGHMLFSSDTTLNAMGVLDCIDLPSGGSVREQQDCVEFMLALIDKCDMAAEKFDRPPVFKRFLEGVMGYEYACKTCMHRHRGADESFTVLNLEIHGSTVGESLDHYMDGALLEGASAAMCEQCGEKRTTLRMGALRSAPTTLCIQLKRFSTFETNGGKLNTKVDVPRELDLTRFSEAVRTASDEQVTKTFGWFDDTEDEPVVYTPPADCPVRWRYRLVGVIVHSGQLGNGHYTSYVKERRPIMRGRPWYDAWLLANDERVCVQDEKIALEWQGNGEENSPSAYLLTYEMIEEDERSAMVGDTVVVAPKEDTVAPLEDTVAPAEDTVATPEDTVAPSKDTVAPTEDTVAKSNGDTTAAVPMEEDTAPGPNGEANPQADTVPMSNGHAVPGPIEDTVAEPMEEDSSTANEDTVPNCNGEGTSEDSLEDTMPGPMEEDTVAVPNDTVLVEISKEALAELQRKQKEREECEWMDIGLGSLGLLEGPLLDLWKCVPDRLRFDIVERNVGQQLSHDVLTESYARFLLSLLEQALRHARIQQGEEKYPAMRAIIKIARDFSVNCLWTTPEMYTIESDPVIKTYKLLMENLLKEHPDFNKEYLASFFDAGTQSISYSTKKAIVDNGMLTRTAISAWWHLASQAVTAVRGDAPALVEAYCRCMVENLELYSLRVEGYANFFTCTVTSPHCADAYVKANLIQKLVDKMFYPNKKGGYGLHGDFTSRSAACVISSLFDLWRDAIVTRRADVEAYQEFVEKKLFLAMGPMARHGEAHLAKTIELFVITLRVYGERDEESEWTTRMAQAVLNCLKIDQHRADSLFKLIISVGKALSVEVRADFYDEILGKREEEAVENGNMCAGVVQMLENMLASKQEAKKIALVESALWKAMEVHDDLRIRAEEYDDRLDAIKQRVAEWKEEEAVTKADLAAQLSMNVATRSMLMGAEAIGMLPIDACGPIARPAGGLNGREYDMMNVSEDEELDEDDEECISDEEDASDIEGPVNLSNHRR